MTALMPLATQTATGSGSTLSITMKSSMLSTLVPKAEPWNATHRRRTVVQVPPRSGHITLQLSRKLTCVATSRAVAFATGGGQSWRVSARYTPSCVGPVTALVPHERRSRTRNSTGSEPVPRHHRANQEPVITGFALRSIRMRHCVRFTPCRTLSSSGSFQESGSCLGSQTWYTRRTLWGCTCLSDVQVLSSSL